MIVRLILTLWAGGVYFAFGSLAWANIMHGGPYTLFGMWWGFMIATVAAFLFTLKWIWDEKS